MSEAQMDRPGVSADLFCLVEKYLRRAYHGKHVVVDQEIVNRWIALLGRVEREYMALAETQK